MNRLLYNFKIGILFSFTLLFTFSCTDLEIEETDSNFTSTGGGDFTGVADPAAALENVYNGVYGFLGNQSDFFALNEVTTDEQLVPTRGTDWGDNGVWRTLHAHTWNASHTFVLNAWNRLNENTFRASEVIDSRSNASAEEVAQARFLRAFCAFWVMDLYGVLPIRGVDDGPDVNPRVLTRMEAFDFVMEDLTAALSVLPARGTNTANNLLASQASARFLMAKLLLNKHIYNGSGSPDASDMQQVVDLVDAIAAEGFALQEGYFEIFTEDADSETIWWARTSVGNRIWNGMHYNINSPDNAGGGWNGFSTLAEFYDSFEGPSDSNAMGGGQEERRGWVPDASNASAENLGIGYGFLIGQQYDDDGTALSDRPGNPLVFTKALPGLNGNTEATGVRVIKYHPASPGGSFVNHEIVFRYADAHLMKAEALMRMGGDPTEMVNELRTIRSATPLGSVSETELLAERGRELYVEFWRRNDMVRFGEFTRDWEFKNAASVGDATKNLFPIPATALLSNPNLTQNPGY